MYKYLIVRRVLKSDIAYENGVGGSRGYLTKMSYEDLVARKQYSIFNIPKWVRKELGANNDT